MFKCRSCSCITYPAYTRKIVDMYMESVHHKDVHFLSWLIHNIQG